MRGDAQRELDRVGEAAEVTADGQRLLVLVKVSELFGSLLERVRDELLCPFCGTVSGRSHEGGCLVLEVEALAPRVDEVIDGTQPPPAAGRA